MPKGILMACPCSKGRCLMLERDMDLSPENPYNPRLCDYLYGKPRVEGRALVVPR